MKKYSTYVGMDVHARSVTCHACIVETGENPAKTFTNAPSAAAIYEWLSSLPQPVYCAYESGCTAYLMCRELRELGVDCDIIAITTLPKSEKEKKGKCDKLDAKSILGAIMNPMSTHTVVWVPDPEVEGARDLARHYYDAVKSLKRAKQQLLSFLLRYGYVWAEKTKTGRPKAKWQGDFMKWLNAIRLEDELAQKTLELYKNAVDVNKYLVDAAKEAIADAAKSSRWKPYVDAIRQLQGLGSSSAFLAAAEFGDFSRFGSGGQVSCWLGTTPRNGSSGEKEVHGPITKAGNSHLRYALIEGNSNLPSRKKPYKNLTKGQVVSAEVQAIARKGNVRLAKRYRHLTEDLGKNANKAKIAVVSEQVRWIWVIGKTVQSELAAKQI